MVLISVILPFHRDIYLLKRSVLSICSQRLFGLPVSFEIIVGNDSNLSTCQIIDYLSPSLRDGFSLVVINNRYQKGPGGNRNSALEVSSGDWIAFLDADDAWHPMKTYFQYYLLRNEANFVSTSFSYIETSCKIKPPTKLSGFKSVFFSLYPVGTSSVIVSRELLSNSRFNDIWFCQDLVFWSDLLGKPNCVYKSVDIPLVYYSKHVGRTSKASLPDLILSYFRAASIAGLTYFEAILSTFWYLCRGTLNKIIRPYLISASDLVSNIFKGMPLLFAIPRLYYYFTQSFFFDLRHRTNTFPRRKFDESLYKPTNPNDVYYIPVNTDIFLRSFKFALSFIRHFGFSPNEFQFVDLGVGKGKTLMLLLLHFQHISFHYRHLGIDMSLPLIENATSNISQIMHDRPPVHLVNDDAVNCFKHIESDKLIIYAYNPFDGSILRSVLEALDPSICVLFIYVEPAHCDILVDLGFICVFDKKNSLIETNSRHYSIYFKPPSTEW